MRLRRLRIAISGFSLCIPHSLTSKTWEKNQPHLLTNSSSHRSRLSCNQSLTSMHQLHPWEAILPRPLVEISFNTRPAHPLETIPVVDNTVVFRAWHPVESSKSSQLLLLAVDDVHHFAIFDYSEISLSCVALLLTFCLIQLRCRQRWVSSRWYVIDGADCSHVFLSSP